ncbi:hypothetical protein DFA_10152 [Cavenderia fasciculata]|uniref:Transmembrane protein n=1 Tax=Cavenderia fasciculata TaxID=261658 RepID=F4Q9E9_CACFS|nr:uncharacterized protein DFA_10152 [Cavenderia fasciculata]EGG15318.1 hypothetical protein DFA_10152 [Cavenderia fasciculata]|eukprot:XP_004352038.1 hypothetical protein DFA_10152 [Cavenderia fasciculata]
MGILQLALPTSISGAIYIDNLKVPCYKETDIQGKIENCTPANCTVVECKSQGPFSMFQSIALHPFLLVNGLVNIIYYNGEVMLYKEPLGLLFLVISALSSTFLINPLNKLFGEPINQPIPPLIYLFGIAGSLLSVIEVTPKKEVAGKKEWFSFLYGKKDQHEQIEDQQQKEGEIAEDKKLIDEENQINQYDSNNQNNNNNNIRGGNKLNHRINESDTSSIDSPDTMISPILQQQEKDHLIPKEEEEESNQNNKQDWKTKVIPLFARSLRVFIPMILLSVANGLWMETSLYYDNQFRVNAYGYNSIDQILLPFYLFFFMLVIDLIKPLKHLLLPEQDSKETLWEAVKATWKETNLVTLFFYRLLINARAIIYFYLAIQYDLTLVYLELTLTRVVLNWLGAFVLNLVIPKFIKATYEERRKTFYPVNLLLKLFGSIGVVPVIVIAPVNNLSIMNSANQIYPIDNQMNGFDMTWIELLMMEINALHQKLTKLKDLKELKYKLAVPKCKETLNHLYEDVNIIERRIKKRELSILSEVSFQFEKAVFRFIFGKDTRLHNLSLLFLDGFEFEPKQMLEWETLKKQINWNMNVHQEFIDLIDLGFTSLILLKLQIIPLSTKNT